MDGNPENTRFQRRVQTLFERALDLPPKKREAWLRKECGDDSRLLAEATALLSVAGESEEFLESDQVARSLRAMESLDPGETVGPYEIVRELGRGGMGIVFLARRADGQFEQQVALKLLKGGMNSRAILDGFLRERQILAWLQHPHISRLLDGGLTPDGRPWFALEYVEGRPITQYSEDENLSMRERIELVIDACEAVQYAHRNLVIHRDLKPSNMLVTADGQLKLLDFGIAAVLRESGNEPGTGMPQPRAMTPEYAAPEQLQNRPVTTATDIHALGVLLHELLTGRRPDRFPTESPEDLARKASDASPRLPSRMAGKPGARRRLKGDLDRILLKAIHEEPARRYSTPEAMALDLRRYLEGHPVAARRQTLVYRLSKFTQRNRWGLLGVLMVTVVLAGAAVFASRQSEEARRESARAESVKDFLVNLVNSANPNAEGGAAVRDRAVLDVALDRAETELEGQPDMQAELYDVVGTAYIDRGDYASAEAPLLKALELQRKQHGEVHLDVAEAVYAMAALRRREKKFDEAEAYYREAMGIYAALEGERSLNVSHMLNGLGANAYGVGDLDRAENYYLESLSIKEELLNEDDQEIVTGRHNLALLLLRKGVYERAEQLMRQALEGRKGTFGDRHPVMAKSHDGLGRILQSMSRYDEAEQEFRLAYDIRLEAYGTNHPHTRLAQTELAMDLYDAGNLEGAEAELRSLLTAIENDLGKGAPEYVLALCDRADVLVELGRLGEADSAYAEAGRLDAALDTGAGNIAGRTLAGVGSVALARNRVAEALPELASAVAAYEKEAEPEERADLRARVRYGECLSLSARAAEADSVLFPAYRASKEKLSYMREARLAEEALRRHLKRTGRGDVAESLD